MNKEELLKLVESLNLPKEEYYILGGGSLVMFGIKDRPYVEKIEEYLEKHRK